MRLSLLGSAASAVVAGLGLSPWATYPALIAAVAGGVLACVFAWREVRATRTTLLAQQGEDSRRAAELLVQADRRNLHIVSLLSARNGELVRQLGVSRVEAAEQQRTSAALRGDKAALQFELAQRTRELGAVRDSLDQMQAALDSDIVTLPVREDESAVLELWTEDGFPTVVQLEALANPPVVEVFDERKHA